MKLKATFLLAAALFVLGPPSASADEYVSVSVRNNSNVTASIGVEMSNGKYLWKTVQPGQRYYADVQHLIYVPFVSGTQSIRVAIVYNGVTRVGTLPIYGSPFGGSPYYSNGEVFRRSPGILGLRDLGR